MSEVRANLSETSGVAEFSKAFSADFDSLFDGVVTFTPSAAYRTLEMSVEWWR